MDSGTPSFEGKENERSFRLIIELDKRFQAREVVVKVIKKNYIIVSAHHEVRTTEQLFRTKFYKEYKLEEKINPRSLRAGLTPDGRLIIRALGKRYNKERKKAAIEAVETEINDSARPCIMFNLADFPAKRIIVKK